MWIRSIRCIWSRGDARSSENHRWGAHILGICLLVGCDGPSPSGELGTAGASADELAEIQRCSRSFDDACRRRYFLITGTARCGDLNAPLVAGIEGWSADFGLGFAFGVGTVSNAEGHYSIVLDKPPQASKLITSFAAYDIRVGDDPDGEMETQTGDRWVEGQTGQTYTINIHGQHCPSR
jgi:hypothetical protein